MDDTDLSQAQAGVGIRDAAIPSRNPAPQERLKGNSPDLTQHIRFQEPSQINPLPGKLNYVIPTPQDFSSYPQLNHLQHPYLYPHPNQPTYLQPNHVHHPFPSLHPKHSQCVPTYLQPNPVQHLSQYPQFRYEQYGMQYPQPNQVQMVYPQSYRMQKLPISPYPNRPIESNLEENSPTSFEEQTPSGETSTSENSTLSLDPDPHSDSTLSLNADDSVPINKTELTSYEPLSKAPRDWKCFRYNIHGELEPGRTYSVMEMAQYLVRHPLHGTTNCFNSLNGGLRLWIQRTPPARLSRASGPLAEICRFEACSEYKNVIKVGKVRVAFDELSHSHPNHDPQHNAGYVHLHCLERCLDLSILCRSLAIRGEDRLLCGEPFGKNPMSLENIEELYHVRDFVDFSRHIRRYPAPYRPIAIDNLVRQGAFVQKIYDREGNDMNSGRQVMWQLNDEISEALSQDFKLKAKSLMNQKGGSLKRNNTKENQETTPPHKRRKIQSMENRWNKGPRQNLVKKPSGPRPSLPRKAKNS